MVKPTREVPDPDVWRAVHDLHISHIDNAVGIDGQRTIAAKPNPCQRGGRTGQGAGGGDDYPLAAGGVRKPVATAVIIAHQHDVTKPIVVVCIRRDLAFPTLERGVNGPRGPAFKVECSDSNCRRVLQKGGGCPFEPYDGPPTGAAIVRKEHARSPAGSRTDG